MTSFKRCINKVVGTKTLTYIELQMLVSEIELIIHNQQIGIEYDDQEDVLTPNHLIFGHRLEISNGIGNMKLGENQRVEKKKTFIKN